MLRLLPILLTTVVFWAIYAQMGTLFITQGLMMNRVTGGVEVPAAVISVIDAVAIIVLVPLYDKAFLPLARRCGLEVTQLRRIGWGNLVSAATMLAAGYLEMRRLHCVAEGRTAPGQPGVADLSVYWQVPIFFLSGLSEIIGKSILPLPLLLPLPLSLSLSLSSPSPSLCKAPRRRPLLTHARAHPQVTSPHSSSHTSDRPRP